ncbi:flavin reductase-like, FMN-binding protein [Novosphingobium sp. Rr 2-17]|uniref:flavin reductase family protein n=1 Tax=Novosphingobium sp. Rr 2-17 TaxID=555793 RepID=UPI000269A7DF|nr:flavin reductase family protein [Novosphingobium sp. Rr 2-17]EIZ80152.1 flavin reductase-like, FMN-binding protein [Novosphingobium sp. Rr 2-17]
MSDIIIDPAAFRKVLGSYPTGVCIITALVDGKPAGLVVGSFTSVSLDPPLVGFFPDKSSTSWPLVEKAGHFAVNIMGADQQPVCRAVSAKGEAKFLGVDYVISDHNLPIIANSLAVIECRLYSVTEAGDHWFVLGEVLRMETVREDDPMLFHRGRYGSFAQQI